MACKIGRILYVILQFVAFAFVLIGTPIDMFRPKGGELYRNTPCLTLWGAKQNCYSTKYEIRPSSLFAFCNNRLKRWQVAEAFGIISIIILGLGFLCGAISLCSMNCLRWFCLVLNIIGVVTVIIVVALMANEYTSSKATIVPTCTALNNMYKYGAGFGLYIVAWALNLVDIIFLMIPC